MMLTKSLLSVTVVAVLLSGCEMNNTGKGAAIGAAAGGILGKAKGNHKDKRIFIGAAIGALAGAAVGDYMDKQEAAFRDELAGSGVEVVREGDNLRLVIKPHLNFKPCIINSRFAACCFKCKRLIVNNYLVENSMLTNVKKLANLNIIGTVVIIKQSTHII